MTPNTVAREVAESEFSRFCEAMDIDHDTAGMDPESAKDFSELREKLLKAMERGNLVINDDGEPVYTAARSGLPNALTFHEQTGASLMAMDRKKEGQSVGKMFAIMEDMTKQAPGQLSKLKGSDLKVCLAIVTLFLA